MRYAVEILRTAQKQLGCLERQVQTRIIKAIKKLADNPRPPPCIKLSGRPAWRIRIGDYRVIYEIHDDKLVVIVVSIGNRKDIYR